MSMNRIHPRLTHKHRGGVWTACCATLIALSAPRLASAHHSPAAFDMRGEVVLDGTVVEFSWQNPHTSITLEVADANGQRVQQKIEASGASILLPMGVGGDALRPGEHVVIHARPNRRGPGHTVLGVTFMKDDGRVLPLHLSGRAAAETPPAAVASSLEGGWLGQDMVPFRDAMRQWPLTAAARSALGANGNGRNGTRAKCIPYGPPAMMLESVLTTIAVAKDTVTFTTDIDGEGIKRIVHLDRETHPSDLEPSLLGDSIGHWEGDALVVDTTAFAAHPEGFGFGLPSSARKHLVERFSLSPDHRSLVYETSAEDPETLTEPTKFTAHLAYRPDLMPSGTPCDPVAAQRYLHEQ